MRGESGRLILRSRTLPPEPERTEDITLQSEVRKGQGTYPCIAVADITTQILPAYNICSSR